MITHHDDGCLSQSIGINHPNVYHQSIYQWLMMFNKWCLMITHTIASGKHSQLLKPWPSRKFVDLPMKKCVSLHSYVCLPKGIDIYIYIYNAFGNPTQRKLCVCKDVPIELWLVFYGYVTLPLIIHQCWLYIIYIYIYIIMYIPLYSIIYIPGWWFQTFFILHNIWDNPSHWLSYFSEG